MRKRISIIMLAFLLTFSSCCSLVLPFTNQASADTITPTMLAHYPLLEDVQDISGNEKHGTAVGNITYTEGLTLPGEQIVIRTTFSFLRVCLIIKKIQRFLYGSRATRGVGTTPHYSTVRQQLAITCQQITGC